MKVILLNLLWFPHGHSPSALVPSPPALSSCFEIHQTFFPQMNSMFLFLLSAPVACNSAGFILDHSGTLQAKQFFCHLHQLGMLNNITVSILCLTRWLQDWDLIPDAHLLSNDSFVGILFSAVHFNTTVCITHPNWDSGKVVWHIVGDMIVLEELNILHIVAGLHEIDALEVDTVSWIMCYYKRLFYVLGVCGEWRISVVLLYEYAKLFIKNLPEVKAHFKESNLTQKWRVLGLWLTISLHTVTSERFQMVWLWLLLPFCSQFLSCSCTYWLLLFQTGLCCTDSFCSQAVSSLSPTWPYLTNV